MFVDIEFNLLICVTSYVSGSKKRLFFLWQLYLWLELKVDLDLYKPVVDLVSFTIEQVWLGDTNLSIWECWVGCF